MSLKPTITYDDFSKLDLRIATIVAADHHPNADRLLRLQIDLGGDQRQICAGVKQYYDASALVGKQVVVVANLQPRMIRGEVSNGMLLAATVTDGDEVRDVVILELAKPVPAGATVA
jgi:methionine--tRNA ligase beta chain